MSLMRLLTATRSISDVKNEPSPYRMTQQGLLPKFGPRRRAPVKQENLGEGNGNRMEADCSLKSESSRKPKRLAAWWEKLFRRKARREPREPVQAELALDTVKVVRNDLSDVEAAETAKPVKGRLKVEPPPVEESVFGASRG